MQTAELSAYLTGVNVHEGFVSMRDDKYPITAVHPSGARYNEPGQTAYHFALGSAVVRAEKFRDPSASIPSGESFYGASGTFECFDLAAYLADHPSESTEYFSTTGDSGYAKCRELRTALEEQRCGGIVYPSQRLAGGTNLALWPVGTAQLPPDFLEKLPALRAPNKTQS